jgi:hypothetical protein
MLLHRSIPEWSKLGARTARLACRIRIKQSLSPKVTKRIWFTKVSTMSTMSAGMLASSIWTLRNLNACVAPVVQLLPRAILAVIPAVRMGLPIR